MPRLIPFLHFQDLLGSLIVDLYNLSYLYNLISELNRGGMTILMISHDMNAALRYASHILHVGASSFFGTKDDYLKAGGARRYLRRRGGERV